MKYELLSEDHQSYAVNPIIAHALFYVQYIEELGTGTVDIFNICKATGLQPPVFDIDAQHFTVTVYRPIFDEQGNRVPIALGEVKANTSEVGPKATEVGVETPEVGVETPEVGPKNTEVGPKTAEVGPKPDFEVIMKNYRKDFRITCAHVWECLAADTTISRRAIASRCKIADSSVQSAMNALQEVGLLKREGYGKGRAWIVRTMPDKEDNQS
jgi:predicted HTH transcriptional regulator